MRIGRRYLGILAAGAGTAHAQGGFPSRPLTWVVPFTAAGVTDTNSRLISRKLGQRLGQPIVIENRPGAGGTLGTEYVARAAPDGYTILYGTNAAMAAAPTLFRRLGYDPVRSFVPIQALFESSNVLVANPNLPYRDLPGLVAYAKAHPARINLAHAGVGTSTHLTAVLLESVAGIEMTHIAYQGAAAALTDVMAGNVDVLFDYVVSSREHIANGRMRALAVTARQRIPALRDVPTVVEAGFPEIVSSNWSGLFLPAATPREVVLKMVNEAQAVMRDPEVLAVAESNGSRAATELTGEVFGQFLASEIQRWGDIVRRSGAQPM
ncbi:Bug family tripartite tricarboxylate transporter substrate binding protein [Roseococcus sp. YIM B11640]|uniref:Bug family tripartite tricarboxylate transporter substrate binding protein n=1 Tax=Roseococcus sp. YIM B11640 TaxID=3133973 RepID=UPI003C79EA36